MRQIKGMQLGAVLGAMLFMMATIAVPVAIADTGTPSSTQSTCTTCGAQTANCGSVNLTVTKLDGSESKEFISSALKNEKVKDLIKKLIEEEYTPRKNDAAAYKMTTVNGSIVSEKVNVVIPFKSHDTEGNATIIYSENTGKVTAEGIIQEGNVTTLFKDGSKYQTGPANELRKPLEILQTNSTYIEVTTNFTQSGAIVREDLATVMINYSSKIASIIIPVQNGTGFITAEINLRNEKVISIVDPSYWDCIYGCMPDWLKGVCTVSCMNCATQLSIPWCLACGACGCGAGWCAGYCVPDAFKPILCPAAWLACIAGNGAACCVDSGCNA